MSSASSQLACLPAKVILGASSAGPPGSLLIPGEDGEEGQSGLREALAILGQVQKKEGKIIQSSGLQAALKQARLL